MQFNFLHFHCLTADFSLKTLFEARKPNLSFIILFKRQGKSYVVKVIKIYFFSSIRLI